MHFIDPRKTGLSFGVFLGGLHLVWSLLVLTGLAQQYLDFIFTLHMLKPVMIVDDFNLVLTIALVLVTGILGYLMGYCFAAIWNRLHK